MCLYPKIIQNKKYTKTKKNGGIIPTVTDKRVLYVPAGCGKCMECRKQKARQWQVRLQEDIKKNKNGKFVTLTLSDESITNLQQDIKGVTGYNLDNEIATKATRRFLERWRKKYKKSVRHWLVTELGQTSTERVHLHGIIWTDEIEEISRIWGYGFITIGQQKWNNGIKITDGESYVNEKTINYITKYVTKRDEKHKEYESKILTSPGIGRDYIDSGRAKRNKFDQKNTKEEYRTRQGIKLNLPIYYRNHIYTDDEKEKLWIEKLNKEERWVDGRPSDISQNEEHYYLLLEEARRKNKELGYGDNTINWERKKYENERRNLIKLQKIQKGSARQRQK